MGWRLSSRLALACSRKRCARMRAKATSGCNSARSPRPILRSRSEATRSSIRSRGPTRMWCCAPATRRSSLLPNARSKTCWSECGEHNQVAEARPLTAKLRPHALSAARAERRPAGPSSQHQESGFFKSILCCEIALGMKRAWHQLPPAVSVQQVVDRAVAGDMPDRFLVGRLEIMNVQHLAGAGRFGKTREQGLFFEQRHVLVVASAIRLGLERLDAAVVISHVRAVHRTQRHAHCSRNRRLRHPTLTQQHHLDALALCGRYLPP